MMPPLINTEAVPPGDARPVIAPKTDKPDQIGPWATLIAMHCAGYLRTCLDGYAIVRVHPGSSQESGMERVEIWMQKPDTWEKFEELMAAAFERYYRQGAGPMPVPHCVDFAEQTLAIEMERAAFPDAKMLGGGVRFTVQKPTPAPAFYWFHKEEKNGATVYFNSAAIVGPVKTIGWGPLCEPEKASTLALTIARHHLGERKDAALGVFRGLLPTIARAPRGTWGIEAGEVAQALMQEAQRP